MNQFVFPEFPVVKKINKKLAASDYIFALPYGKKVYIWFHDGKCYLTSVGKTVNEISILRELDLKAADTNLFLNTLLLGTLFTFKGRDYFSFENLLFYCGNPTTHVKWEEKLQKMTEIMEKKILYSNKTNITIGLPLVAPSLEMLESKQSQYCMYNTYAYAYRRKNESTTAVFILKDQANRKENKEETRKEYEEDNRKRKVDCLFEQNDVLEMICPSLTEKPATQVLTEVPRKIVEAKKKTQILLLKPDIQNDIYHLFSKGPDGSFNKKEGIALIPNYETSVMLNKVFRNIKENQNLDALEESDDEEEFEDNREDKFVFLEKTALFLCSYNFKFKKWTPILCQENK